MSGFGYALRLFLAAALLAGWQAAIVHPLAHADESGRLVHSGGSSQHEERGNGANALCDAIAALAVCAQGPARLPAIVPAAADSARAGAARPPRCAALLAYRSQAPPRLS
ncbi:MAG: hypothetical protein AB1773_04390 [Pseudomonadota bacterium]